MSKLLQAPRLAAITATASTRAKRDQPKHRGCVVMSAVPWGTASLAAKVSNTDPLRERVASPASPVFQRRLSAPVYLKTQALAMRLSRHSARIKAKVKAKTPDFQDTSGPYAGATRPVTRLALPRTRRTGSAASTTRQAVRSAISADSTA